jgi:flagellar motor switch protein FliN/FliY
VVAGLDKRFETPDIMLHPQPQQLVRLDKVADAPVDLQVNSKLIARGEVVVVDNRFGIKITELLAAG